MNQSGRAQLFARLHVKRDPLVLFNVWDAGSAKAVESIGAKALATGSWSVAAADGYVDAEVIPLDTLLANLAPHRRLCDAARLARFRRRLCAPAR